MIDSLNTAARVPIKAGLVNVLQPTIVPVMRTTSWLENIAVPKVNGAATLITKILFIKRSRRFMLKCYLLFQE